MDLRRKKSVAAADCHVTILISLIGTTFHMYSASQLASELFHESTYYLITTLPSAAHPPIRFHSSMVQPFPLRRSLR